MKTLPITGGMLSWHRQPLFLVAGVCVLLLASCTAAPFQVGTRDVSTQEMAFEDFNEVEISDAFRVEIRQGDEYRVTIEVDEVTRDYLEVNQRGNTLQIRLRPRRLSLFWIFNATQRAQIVMPNLVGVTASDASHVEVSGFHSDGAARFEASDASTLTGEIDSGETRLIVTDASRIELEGNRQDIEIEAADASHVRLVGEGRNALIRAKDASRVDLADFPVQDVDIEAADASYVIVDASGQLNAEAEDASSILYYGEPTVGTTRSSDGSRIEARGR